MTALDVQLRELWDRLEGERPPLPYETCPVIDRVSARWDAVSGDLERIREESLTHDVTGHYDRPDLFACHTKTGASRGAYSGIPSLGIPSLGIPSLGASALGIPSEPRISTPRQPTTEVILPSQSPPTSADFPPSNGAEFLAPAGASAPAPLPAIPSSRSSGYGADIQELNGDKIG